MKQLLTREWHYLSRWPQKFFKEIAFYLGLKRAQVMLSSYFNSLCLSEEVMSSFTSINDYNVNLVKSLLEWVQYTEWVNIKLCETKRKDKQEIWHHKCKISLDRKKRKIGRRDSTMVLPQIKNTPLDQPLIPREGRRGFLSRLWKEAWVGVCVYQTPENLFLRQHFLSYSYSHCSGWSDV